MLFRAKYGCLHIAMVLRTSLPANTVDLLRPRRNAESNLPLRARILRLSKVYTILSFDGSVSADRVRSDRDSSEVHHPAPDNRTSASDDALRRLFLAFWQLIALPFVHVHRA